MIETQCLTDADGLFVTDAAREFGAQHHSTSGNWTPRRASWPRSLPTVRCGCFRPAPLGGCNDMADVGCIPVGAGPGPTPADKGQADDFPRRHADRARPGVDGDPSAAVPGPACRGESVGWNCPAGSKCGSVRPGRGGVERHRLAHDGAGAPGRRAHELARRRLCLCIYRAITQKGFPANHYVLINPGEHLGTSKVLAAWTEKTPMGDGIQGQYVSRSLRQWPCGR